MMLLGAGRIYVAMEPIDMRSGHDRLASMVRLDLGMNEYGGHWFVFFSRRKNRVKILCWERGGFVIYYKRLETGRFQIPMASGHELCLAIDSCALTMLLDGISVSTVERPVAWQPPARPEEPEGRRALG